MKIFTYKRCGLTWNGTSTAEEEQLHEKNRKNTECTQVKLLESPWRYAKLLDMIIWIKLDIIMGVHPLGKKYKLAVAYPFSARHICRAKALQGKTNSNSIIEGFLEWLTQYRTSQRLAGRHLQQMSANWANPGKKPFMNQTKNETWQGSWGKRFAGRFSFLLIKITFAWCTLGIRNWSKTECIHGTQKKDASWIGSYRITSSSSVSERLKGIHYSNTSGFHSKATETILR